MVFECSLREPPGGKDCQAIGFLTQQEASFLFNLLGMRLHFFPIPWGLPGLWEQGILPTNLELSCLSPEKLQALLLMFQSPPLPSPLKFSSLSPSTPSPAQHQHPASLTGLHVHRAAQLPRQTQAPGVLRPSQQQLPGG